MRAHCLRCLLICFLFSHCLWSGKVGAEGELKAVEVIAGTTESEFWLETTYSMAGSAAGNGLALMGFGVLSLLPGFLAKPGEEQPDLRSSPVTLLLLLFPILSTAVALYFFYPMPEGKQAEPSLTLLGSFIGVLVSTLAMIPFFLAANTGNAGQTIVQLAPIAFFLGVVIEGLFGAWFFDMSKSWKVETSQAGPGFTLVHRIAF